MLDQKKGFLCKFMSKTNLKINTQASSYLGGPRSLVVRELVRLTTRVTTVITKAAKTSQLAGS